MEGPRILKFTHEEVQGGLIEMPAKIQTLKVDVNQEALAP